MAIVSFETVAAAAEAIVAAGKRPSVRSVIAELGGGSPNQVLQHLNEWKGGRPVVRPAETPIDARITTAIAEQIQRVAAEASSAAEERAASSMEDLQTLSEAQHALEQQIEFLTSERDTALARADSLSAQLRALEASAIREQQHAVEQMTALSADLASAHARHEQTVSQLAKAEVRLEAIPNLQTEVERLRSLLEAESRGRTAAEQNAAVLAAKLDACEKRMVDLEARERKSDDVLAEAHASVKKALEDAAELRGKVSILEANVLKNVPTPAITKQ